MKNENDVKAGKNDCRQIKIEGKSIHNISSFYKEINRVLMYNEDWQIGDSLDAFNDLLYGGFGVLGEYSQVDMIWADIDFSREALSYNTTKLYYLEKLKPDSVFNKGYFEQQLNELEAGTGKTYFDIVMEIITEHPKIKLIAQ